MADRKNIFLIGRRGHEGDEDQLTEMLAYLWQEHSMALDDWLTSLGADAAPGIEVETQFTLPSGKRPDIKITWPGWTVLVESKLQSGFGDTQISDYLDYLAGVDGRRMLVLLTERPETVPDDLKVRADASRVELVSRRWHDMATHIGEPGEETLAGDFIQLLIREKLVKPQPIDSSSWAAWNAGYGVLLRLGSFLDELDPYVAKGLLSAGRRSSGLTKRWIYNVWRAGSIELGFGFGAAAGDSDPESDPIVFAFVGNKNASAEEAMAAVGVDRGHRGRWSKDYYFFMV